MKEIVCIDCGAVNCYERDNGGVEEIRCPDCGAVFGRDNIPSSRTEIEELRAALEASVRLQSHYAVLLNEYDGGLRRQFASAEEWIQRLRECG
jgi:hypothetical protein